IHAVRTDITVDLTAWGVHVLVLWVPISDCLSLFAIEVLVMVVHVPDGLAAVAVEIANHASISLPLFVPRASDKVVQAILPRLHPLCVMPLRGLDGLMAEQL